MEEMPTSWWNRSGYRACFLIAFLFFAIIATVCCSFSFYFAREQKEEQLFDLPGNWSRIQRAIGIKLGSNARADEFSTNKEIMINGSVTDAVLVNGSLTVKVRANDTEKGQTYLIDSHIPTAAPFPVIPPIENDKNGYTSVQKDSNSAGNADYYKTSPRISARRNSDLKPDANPFIDTRSKINPAPDSMNRNSPETGGKYFGADTRLKNNPVAEPSNPENIQKPENINYNADPRFKNYPRPDATLAEDDSKGTISRNRPQSDQTNNNEPNSINIHPFKLRSVETGSNADSGAEINSEEAGSKSGSGSKEGNAEESAVSLSIEQADINVSNETIPDADPTWRKYIDVNEELQNLDTSADAEASADTEASATGANAEVNAGTEASATDANAEANAGTEASATDANAEVDTGIAASATDANAEANAGIEASATDANAEANAGSEASATIAAAGSQAEPNKASGIASLSKNYNRNGLIPRPLTAAVEQLGLPSNFDNYINTEQKFFLKKSNPSEVDVMQRVKRSMFHHQNGVIDKVNLHSIARLGHIVKKSFVGYPAYYGLWYKSKPFREHIYRKESLHKSDEFQDVPLSLLMDDILNQMANVDDAKIDNFKANQPLYEKNLHRQVANPVPQNPYESIPADSYSPIPADSYSQIPADSYSQIPANSYSQIPADSYSQIPADSSSPLPANNQIEASSASGIEVSDQLSATTSQAIAADGVESASTYEEIAANDEQSASTSQAIAANDELAATTSHAIGANQESQSSTDETPADQNLIQESSDKYHSVQKQQVPLTTTTPSPGSNTTTPPHPTPPHPTPPRSVNNSDCLCDFNCDHISMDFSDFSCENTCRLQGKSCIKNRASGDSLRKSTNILKKNDARVKRNAITMKYLQKLRPGKKSISDFHLFNVIAPRRKIARHNLLK